MHPFRPSGPQRPWRAVCAALLVVAAGCTPSGGSVPSTGGGTATTVPSTTTTTVPDTADAVAAFVSCMAAQGVEVPEVELDATGAPILGDLIGSLDPDDPTVRSALTACAEPLAAAGALDVATDPELRRAVVTRLEDYSACMRREGIDGFPDPLPGFDGSGAPYPPEQVPSSSNGFDEAAATCAAEVAGPGEGD